MGKNKIIYDGTVLIDLTGDTITADKLWQGYTAHGADGEVITGSLAKVPMPTLYYDFNKGYVDNGKWIYQVPTNTFVDIYEVVSGHKYLIVLGVNVGSRFRCMFTTTDVTTITSGNVVGTTIINKNNPPKNDIASFTASADGYLIIAKDNVGKTGVKSYVYDMAAWE